MKKNSQSIKFSRLRKKVNLFGGLWCGDEIKVVLELTTYPKVLELSQDYLGQLRRSWSSER